MTKLTGHDQEVFTLMRHFDLFAVDTLFKPPTIQWYGKKRINNTTYVPLQQGQRPRKLNYFLVSNRWKSSVISSKVQWSASHFHFNSHFDHELVTITWKWKVYRPVSTVRLDQAAMSSVMWREFDEQSSKGLLNGISESAIQVDVEDEEEMFK